MPATHLDHLAITAPTLAEGIEYVRSRLGVAPAPGGRHLRMGTHNALLSLGPSAYLEVIAVDPGGPEPGEPRWFRLDQVRDAPPRLAAWIARTDDLPAAAAADPAYARIEPFERSGLRWDITLPPDGGLVLGGAAPLLIHWRTRPHPAESLPSSGCVLARLEVVHPEPGAVAALLDRIGFQDEIMVTSGPRPGLAAHLLTPDGPRVLASTDLPPAPPPSHLE
jgi:hypothetical protein